MRVDLCDNQTHEICEVIHCEVIPREVIPQVCLEFNWTAVFIW